MNRTKKCLVFPLVVALFLFVPTFSSCSSTDSGTDEVDEEEVAVEFTESDGYVQNGGFTVDSGTIVQTVEKYLTSIPDDCSGFERGPYDTVLFSTWPSEYGQEQSCMMQLYSGRLYTSELPDEITDSSVVPDGIELSFDLFWNNDNLVGLFEETTNATMAIMRAVGFTKDDISDYELHDLIYKPIDHSFGSASGNNVGDANGHNSNARSRVRTVDHGSFKTVIISIEPVISLSDISHRQVISFGSYEQDSDTANGKEQIEWSVLDEKDGKMLIISNNALDCKSYSDEDSDITWESSFVRKWLAEDFYDEAFTEDEKKMICETELPAINNSHYGTSAGNSTSDKVFLLSQEELEKYFPNYYEEQRQCKATKYAVEQGSPTGDDGYNTQWLLRTPGENQEYVLKIEPDGKYYNNGGRVNKPSSVRPAMWVTLQP